MDQEIRLDLKSGIFLDSSFLFQLLVQMVEEMTIRKVDSFLLKVAPAPRKMRNEDRNGISCLYHIFISSPLLKSVNLYALLKSVNLYALLKTNIRKVLSCPKPSRNYSWISGSWL